MRFFKMKIFSGEETNRQKKIRRLITIYSIPVFLHLMRLTRIDRFMQWQETTTRHNQMIIFIIMSSLVLAMTVSPFFNDTSEKDNRIIGDKAFVESMNAHTQIYASPDPRVVRLAQLLDSMKVNRSRLETDTTYLDAISNILIKKMSEEKLMDIPNINSK